MKNYTIRNIEFRHCFCCKNADNFIVSDEAVSLEDTLIDCRYFPNQDKLVEIGTNCPYFVSLFAERVKQKSLFQKG